ncbi:hypothetical protein HJC23_013460 [Cyclotella cryptica]|uniref:Late endosomal/lysosomal adaptor and MAPK and MTOR activator 4 n=1 Tax=Cyclotella cryptica TaxID=29204 RepID=A0ABD3QBA3_9STRA|eukprot:CCRYP_006877-RA/>CCRYP_006877-RA protein AED:0.32 eAED:0.32 QI:0/-1/0/1/-1/1/1/0/113
MSEVATSQPPPTSHNAPLNHLPAPPSTIDLDSVPNQIGHAVLSPDGTLLRPPVGSLSENDAAIVYRMMLEVGTALKPTEEGLKRVTVGFGRVSYAVVVGGDGCLYIVKKRSSA